MGRGENLAWGSGSRSTPSSIVRAWMASDGHRANILSAAFRDIDHGSPGAPVVGGWPCRDLRDGLRRAVRRPPSAFLARAARATCGYRSPCLLAPRAAPAKPAGRSAARSQGPGDPRGGLGRYRLQIGHELAHPLRASRRAEVAVDQVEHGLLDRALDLRPVARVVRQLGQCRRWSGRRRSGRRCAGRCMRLGRRPGCCPGGGPPPSPHEPWPACAR